MSANSPIETEGNGGQVFIPEETLVICNNGHGYDAARHGRCPACGSYDRMSFVRLTSPDILGPRILKAIGTALAERRAKSKSHKKPGQGDGHP